MSLPEPLQLMWQELLTLYIYVAVCVTLVALAIAWLLTKIFPRKLIRRNFLDRPVPLIGGIAVVASLVLLGAAEYSDVATNGNSIYQAWNQALAFTICSAGFGMLGFVDDLLGDRTAGGFRGHLLSLVRGRKVTTGLVKAIGGGIIGLITGYYLSSWTLRGDPSDQVLPRLLASPIGTVTILLYGAFIALFANSLNLVDLRPGRCVTATLVVVMAAMVVAAVELQVDVIDLLLIVFGSAIAIYPFDRAAKVMLGDTGSNALGAAIAVCCICLMKRWEVAIGVLLLAAFQLWCEKHSLTQFIESKPLLRSIDRKIGVR